MLWSKKRMGREGGWRGVTLSEGGQTHRQV